jgi:hypothetical protein
VAYVVRQDYVLSDDKGNEFGKDGNDYYGYGFGPAIMLKEKLVFSKTTFSQSHRFDSTYQSYGAGYEPKPGATYTKLSVEKDFKVAESDSLVENPSYYLIKVADSNYIKQTQFEKGTDIKCVVVTYLTSDKELTDKTTYDLSYLYTKVSWKDNTTGTLANNNLGSRTAFGLIFYEHIGNGTASLVFGGFVEKGKDGTWICTPYSTLSTLTPTKVEEEKDKKDKKKKKKKGKKKP